MKKIILFIMLTTFTISCSSTSNSNQVITGHIENNSEYRGGANPPDFLLEELAVYKPSSNQTFYVRNATNYQPFAPIITSFSTDGNGDFAIDLPEGNYAVICQDKYDFEQNPQATANCEYLIQPDFVLNIVASQQNYSCQYTNTRNNCTTHLPN